MDEKDLKQTREVVREEVKTGFREGFAEVWEGNLEPAFNQIHESQSIMQTKLDKALYKETERITKLEKDVKVIKEKLGIR